MNQQKGLAPILIILLIAAAVGGYLIYSKYSVNQTKTPQQNTTSPVPTDVSPVPNNAGETTSWKTYTDPQSLFTIKYPNDNAIKIGRVFSPPVGALTDMEIRKVVETYREGDIRPFFLTIIVTKNDQGLTIERQKAAIQKLLSPNMKPYKNGEINGIYYVGGDGLGIILQITEDKIYEFSFVGGEGQDAGIGPEEETMKYIDQMLATFKLIP
ncbi:MAG: hypothetical protein ACD_38C00164G0008 [uncultured bacterium]|uniref:Uncharacterized protein n=1 Tax=Candidatus Daviesbacteria bacterium GW2011_GWC2_40_12 TaxID=1618431 RepID=A0A0G0QPS9_9BACT|nr:MAG: hypothetical protein ACD_38C00164G0008 [uncultured bacterium]KKQ84698.1 MAG: hypothetical protein UT04_C0012G0003 [Candidatus Daviesbacteria bacterium GW2011_GWF2_38_7]KKR17033.1 MAG: hypothetical protein UT45_C0003G0063 [Candidatus Daviesbacteria bacterium GW2011_GWA2_39_33]KKR42098.1 MAG: hypothetical protein UT77_C0004G0082 [Candidatus Daviesbacteria bacterium GW2011_GWC2_40_12]OGE20865.1 MAG: hypothetical protein A2778_06355 [Candidatus Daviesbacteria bacterium RIFCSPHIGHO2_01_FULL_